MSKILIFQYRDGANYKWSCSAKVSDEKIVELEKVYGQLEVESNEKNGTEIFYDYNLGISKDEFHEERGYKYDDEIDHNILTLQNILTEEEAEKENVFPTFEA